jgi:hypothetical protein
MSLLRTYPQTGRTLAIDILKINAKETLIAALGEPIDARQNLWYEQKIAVKLTPQNIREFLNDCSRVFGEIDTILIDRFHDSDAIIQFAREKGIKVVEITAYPGFKGKLERYLKQRIMIANANATWLNRFPLTDTPPIRQQSSEELMAALYDIPSILTKTSNTAKPSNQFLGGHS